MSNYRRLYIPGATYFFTLVTHQRQPILCTPKAISRLKAAFQHVKNKHPFHTAGMVILPDHLHCIWQLPENDSNFSLRWNLIKGYFSLKTSSEKTSRREKNIWQKRFWEHYVRDENDFGRHLDYIYYNPVKHGYVSQPHDWIYSTFKWDVRKGLYPLDWGSYREPKNIIRMDCE